MPSGNLYGLIIAILSLAITIVLTMQHIKQNGFHLEIIVQPAPSYVPPGRSQGQQPQTQSELKAKVKVALSEQSQHKRQ
jgi:hypothetical protein